MIWTPDNVTVRPLRFRASRPPQLREIPGAPRRYRPDPSAIRALEKADRAKANFKIDRSSDVPRHNFRLGCSPRSMPEFLFAAPNGAEKMEATRRPTPTLRPPLGA